MSTGMDRSKEITAQLAQGMGPMLHWFPSDVSCTRLATVMVGMANTAGGRILLGIAPRSGQIQGIPNVRQAYDIVFQSALLADPPLVLPLPRVMEAGSVRVLEVIVPSGLPNVYNHEGRYLGREGHQTYPLPARRLRQLLMERGAINFENQVPPQATKDDLDWEKIEAYVQKLELPGSESAETILLRRGCLLFDEKTADSQSPITDPSKTLEPKEGKGLRPTYAALLLFGRYPQQWLPSAVILAARFTGESMSDRFVKQEITGTLPSQLAQAEVFVRDHMHSVVHLSGLIHRETPEYPMEAVRELLVNAVAHRDYNVQGDLIHLQMYSDRLEVHSPGNLPGPVTLKNLLQARFSRNAVIMQVLADMGFVERLGYGLNRVVELTRLHQMRPPLFEEIAGTFRVSLFGVEAQALSGKAIQALQSFQGSPFNARQELALKYLVDRRRITNREYQDLCPDVHSETLRRDLVDLVDRGVIIKIGSKRATYYVLKQ